MNAPNRGGEETRAGGQPPLTSIFGKVDQGSMLDQIASHGGDLTDSNFFGEEQSAADPRVNVYFEKGVATFTGVELTDSTSTGRNVGAGENHVPPVEFKGKLASGPAARAAFIRFGPRGVNRLLYTEQAPSHLV